MLHIISKKHKSIRLFHTSIFLLVILLFVSFTLLLVNSLQQKTNFKSQAVYPCGQLNQSCGQGFNCCSPLQCLNGTCTLVPTSSPQETLKPRSTKPCLSPNICLLKDKIAGTYNCAGWGLKDAPGTCSTSDHFCCEDTKDTCSDLFFRECKFLSKSDACAPQSRAPGNCPFYYTCCWKKIF